MTADDAMDEAKKKIQAELKKQIADHIYKKAQTLNRSVDKSDPEQVEESWDAAKEMGLTGEWVKTMGSEALVKAIYIAGVLGAPMPKLQ